VAVNAIAVQYVRQVDSLGLAALQVAELFLVISDSFNSVRRTDRSTELCTITNPDPSVKFPENVRLESSALHKVFFPSGPLKVPGGTEITPLETRDSRW